MKLSVALATYNGGRHLREQLDSIARQTLLPTELVVSDDGSSDDTLAIARRFAADAPFPVVVVTGERLGFTKNFVRAITRCTGDLVALCDQDDVWSAHKLAVATVPFADAAVTTVTHRVQVVDHDLKPTSLVMPEGSYHGNYTLFTIDPWFSPNGMQMLFRRAAVAPWLSGDAPLSAYGFGTAPFDEWIFYLGTLTGTAVLLDDLLGVWRRHAAAITRDVQSITADASATHHLQLALHSGGDAYAFRAAVTDSRAEAAAREVTSSKWGNPVPGAADFYRGMSAMFRRRVHLHGVATTRPDRLVTFGKMVAHRDYRQRDRGGLGAKAILKDAFTVLFGPRSGPIPA